MVQADRHRVKFWIMPLNRKGCGGGERASKTALRCRAEEIPWVCVGHVVMVYHSQGVTRIVFTYKLYISLYSTSIHFSAAFSSSNAPALVCPLLATSVQTSLAGSSLRSHGPPTLPTTFPFRGAYAETLKILTCGLTIGPSESKTL